MNLLRSPLTVEDFVAHWIGVGAALDPASSDPCAPASISAASAHQALIEAWQEPHRAYHTLAHLAACLQAFDALADRFADRHGAALALWYHDAVYDTRRSDNEARSAELARGHLGSAGARPDTIAHIEALIDATRHADEPDDEDARLLVDIDLGILSVSPDQYTAYEAQIRQEYAWVPDAVFRTTRAGLLRRFLEAPIYRTAPFADREAAARRNLTWAIARLEGAR
ncbi:MAG: N-methyl-D-aspartate receptor NMDAR2C subunit [Pseudomonadota bacterium]|nr:N-methyl-D-aspartate receptor NMDAR2C subunit [Pseudomonadota bacterium]